MSIGLAQQAPDPVRESRTRDWMLCLGLVVGYAGLYFCQRIAWPNSLHAHDYEQVLFSQAPELGYSQQPPLYTWLVWAASQVLESGPLVFILLRTVLLASLCLFHFLFARTLLGDGRLAAAATLALLVMFKVTISIFGEYTHTLLFSALGVATGYAFVRLVSCGRTYHYVLLGVLVGLGCLSKYTYAVFILAMVLSALIVRPFRSRVLDRRTLLTLAIGLGIVLPHLFWLADHWGVVYRAVAKQTGATAESGTLEALALGGSSLAVKSLMVLSPLWLVLPIVFRRCSRADGPPQPGHLWLGYFLLISMGMLLAGVVAMRGTRVEFRHVLPFLMIFPIWFFGRLDVSLLVLGRLRIFAWLALVGAVVGVGYVQGQRALCSSGIEEVFGESLIFPGRLRRACDYQPFDAHAEQLTAHGFRGGTIIAGDCASAGKLRLLFPQDRVLCPEHLANRPPSVPPDGQTLVVWRTDRGDSLPSDLGTYVTRELGLTLPPPEAIRFTQTQDTVPTSLRVRLGFVLLNEQTP